MVPTFTCGLDRTNFSFPMTKVSSKCQRGDGLEPTTGLEPVTSSLPRKCSTPELGGQHVRLAVPASGRPDSNRRRSAWKADALPTELLPRSVVFSPIGFCCAWSRALHLAPWGP